MGFARFSMPRGRRYALVVVLSHSRLLWLSFYRRQTMGHGAVLTAGLESAFARFSGVPKELLPVTRNGATLFLQLINERYERASTVLTSNKGFSRSGGRSSGTR